MREWGSARLHGVRIVVCLAIFLMVSTGIGQARNLESGTIRGRILTTDGAEPVAGATVTIGDYVTFSDEDGVYELKGLDSGVYSITVSAEGYATSSKDSVTIKDRSVTTQDFTIESTPLPGYVTGWVVNSLTMQPVYAAKVSVGTAYTYTINPPGFFNLTSLSPGSYTLTVQATTSSGGYYTYTRESPVTVVSGRGTDVGYLTLHPLTRKLPADIYEASAAWTGTEALLFGGWHLEELNQVVKYNPTSNTTTVVSGLFPSARYLTSAVWTGQYGYVFGGLTPGSIPTKEVIRYTPSTNAVTVYAKLPKAMYDGVAVWTGQYAYVIGGSYITKQGGMDTLDTIVRWDPGTNRATTMGAKLPVTLADCGAAYDGQYIYIFGGISQGLGLIDEIFRYDPVSDTISQLTTKLPSALRGIQAIADGGQIYLYGIDYSGSVYRFDGTTQTLVLLPRKSMQAYPPTAGVSDGYTTFLFRDNEVVRYQHESLVSGTGVDQYSMFVGGIVNPANGNLVIRSEDMSFSVKGFEISFTRTYNSLAYNQVGPLGYGWTHSYNIYATAQQYGDVVITEACGSKHLFMKEPNGYYRTPPGIEGRLTGTIAGGNLALWSPDGTKTSFDTSGKISSVVDRNGNSLQFVYQSGNLVNITDGSGLYLRFVYDTSNRIVRLYNVYGESINYYYYTDAPRLGCLGIVGRFDASGQIYVPVEFIGYMTDGTKRLSSVRFNVESRYVPEIGVVAAIVDCTELVYDSSNRVSEVWKAEAAEIAYPDHIYPAVRKYKMDYLSATLTRATCSLGGTLDITSNAEGVPLSASGSPMVGDAACGNGGGSCSGSSLFPGISGNKAATMTWSNDYRLLTWADAKGNTQKIEYDGLGNVVVITDASSNRTAYSYTLTASQTQFFVTLKSETDALGYATRYTYDANGNLLRATDAKNFYTENVYGSYGQILTTRDKRGYNTTYEYDSHGYIISTVSPIGAETVIGRNTTGEVTNVTTSMGYTTDYEYVNGEVVFVQYPDGTTVRYDRNPQGDVFELTPASGVPTYYKINVTLRTTDAVTNELNHTTRYYYDTMGHLTKTVDANNHTYTMTYDSYARVTSIVYPLGQHFHFTYDNAGNLLTRTDPNQDVTTYTYDVMNRLIQTTYPNGDKVVWTYDALGRNVNISGLGFWEKLTYDEVGNIVRADTHYETTPPGQFYSYFYNVTEILTYDANGNGLTDSFDDGTIAIQNTYAYDAVNRLTRVGAYNGMAWNFSYDLDNRRTSMISSYGTTVSYRTNYDYDVMGRVKNITTGPTAGGSLFLSYAYEYDDVGRIETATELSGSSTSYEYDDLGQLTRYVKDGVWTNYTYDAVGNRLTETTAGGSATYVYDANDRLTSIGSDTNSYDNNGNLIYDNASTGLSFSYDYENHIVANDVLEPSYIYNYSGDGKLMIKHIYFKAGKNYKYVYSHMPGLPTVALSRLDLGGVGEPEYIAYWIFPGTDEFLGLGEKPPAAIYYDMFAFVDGLGNTRYLRYLDGSMSFSQSYTPFGGMSSEPYADYSTWAVVPSFQGRFFDTGSCQYDFRARNYDPLTGRFAQTDPRPSYGSSLYAFVNNNPLTGRDPTGQMPKVGSPLFWLCIVKVALFGLSIGIAILGILANPHDFVDHATTMGLMGTTLAGAQAWLTSMSSAQRDPLSFVGKAMKMTMKVIKEWWIKTVKWYKRAIVLAQIALSFVQWPVKVIGLLLTIGFGLWGLYSAGCI